MEHVLNWMSTHYENSKFAQAKEFLHNRTVYRIKLAGILLSTLTVLITMIVCTVKWFNIKLTKEGTIHCETGINCTAKKQETTAFFYILERAGGKEAVPESRQAFEVATAQTSGLINLIFSLVKRVSLSKHPFIDDHGWL